MSTQTAARPGAPAPTGAPHAGTPRKPRSRPAVRRRGIGPWTGTGLTLGLVALWFILQTLLLGNLSQSRAQTTLYDNLRENMSQGTVPMQGFIEPGSAVALLRVPGIGMEQVVVEGTSSGDLLAGPGHKRNSVMPGQAGVSVLYGRARTYGAPFGRLTQLKEGDTITTVSGVGEATYTVTGVRRTGDPQPKPVGEGKGRLTLVTAEGSNSLLAPLSPGETVYVDAMLTSKPLEATVHPVVVGEFEQAMATDTRRLPLLTVALAGLILIGVTLSWALARWPATFVWLILAPIGITVAWFTMDLAMHMLPNLM